MSIETTGITKKEAEKAVQTIIESAHILLGYHNTFAFDTVCRKLRLLNGESLIGKEIVELIGDDPNVTKENAEIQLENHVKQISKFIDIRSIVVEIVDRAEEIRELQGDVCYLELKNSSTQNNPE